MTIPQEISTPPQKNVTPPTAQPKEQEPSLDVKEQGVSELSEQGTSCQMDASCIYPLQDEDSDDNEQPLRSSSQDKESDYNEQLLRRSSRSRRRPDRLNDYVVP